MTVVSLVTPLKNRVCFISGVDIIRVSPDVPCGAEQINKIVDILWMNDPFEHNKESVFAGFALHGIKYLLHDNKTYLLISEVPVSLVFNLFIRKHGEGILGKYKKEIHTLLKTVRDDIISIPTT